MRTVDGMPSHPQKNDRLSTTILYAGAFVALLVVAAALLVARIKTTKGEGVINEAAAFFIGLQTAAAIILAALTANYVRLTRDLVARSIADAEERTDDRARAEKRAVAADLDETRRLAYAAQLTGSAPAHPELAGTIVNALVHHYGADPAEAMANVPAVVNGAAPNSPPTAWLLAQIQAINERVAGLSEDC